MNLNKEALDRYITGNYGEDQFKHGFDAPVLFCMCGDDIDVEIKRDESKLKNLEDYHGDCPNCGRIWTIRCSGSHPEEGG